MTRSIAELRAQGVTFQPDEAVAMPFDRKPAPRGVLDRLKLGWLRRAFTVHSDL